MDHKARLRHLRISPKKIQRYLNMVRGAQVDVAVAKLASKKIPAAIAIMKLINSAAAQGEGKMIVKKIFVTPGPSLKRMRPAAQGRAHMYKRRSSHITVEVGEK